MRPQSINSHTSNETVSTGIVRSERGINLIDPEERVPSFSLETLSDRGNLSIRKAGLADGSLSTPQAVHARASSQQGMVSRWSEASVARSSDGGRLSSVPSSHSRKSSAATLLSGNAARRPASTRISRSYSTRSSDSGLPDLDETLKSPSIPSSLTHREKSKVGNFLDVESRSASRPGSHSV